MHNDNSRVIIIGDSSIPPRVELPYSKTYTTLLKNRHINMNMEIVAITGNTSKKIALGIEPYTLYGFNPHTVILNYGIADVYPRPYPNWMNRLLACSGLQAYMDAFLKKTKLYYLLGDWFGYCAVPYNHFQRYSEEIVDQLLQKGVQKIVFIGIIRPSKILLHSKTVDEKIQHYNGVFQSLAQQYATIDYIDIYTEADESFTIWDGYQYSEKGSLYLVEKIAASLNG